MPLIAHSQLPTYERLRREGQVILEPGQALAQDIREMHIGILNMMQDAALEATERQFVRLLGNSSQIVQVFVHLINIDGIERRPEAKAHINQFYTPFEKIQEEGLDALILTGTNLADADMTKAPFWKNFCDVLDWAQDNVTSVLCSCLATHAVVRYLYGIERRKRPEKLWGVYEHTKTDRSHPLLQGTNTRFFVPHSRHNDISRQEFLKAGTRILVESPEAGVHMATSKDGFRFVFFQGHPEYDTNSLLKEYKREIRSFLSGIRPEYPSFPSNYMTLQSRAILNEFEHKIRSKNAQISDFPEKLINERMENIWRDTSKSVLNNWIGHVYQTTNIMDRKKQFLDGINPENPLGLADIK